MDLKNQIRHYGIISLSLLSNNKDNLKIKDIINIKKNLINYLNQLLLDKQYYENIYFTINCMNNTIITNIIQNINKTIDQIKLKVEIINNIKIN